MSHLWLVGREWRQSDVMFCNFRSKIRVCGNRCHTLILKSKDNRKSLAYSNRMGYKPAISDFWNFENFGNFDIFSTFFIFFQKIPPNLKNFKKKNGIYVLEEPVKNVWLCTKFQVVPFRNVVFIELSMWKMATFQGIQVVQVVPCISIFSFYYNCYAYATNDVLRSLFAF